MGISLTHPQRQSRQYAYSDRDIAYLEKNGWVREQLAHSIVREATTEGSLAGSRNEVSPPLSAKRGRPRKP